jgi:cytochrome b6
MSVDTGIPTKTARFAAWLDDRLSLSALRALAAQKTVPVHRFMPLYYFGGMTLFFFAVQVMTGILLMLY